MNMKRYLRRVASAAITDEDVHRDPAKAFHVALAAARAAYLARTASAMSAGTAETAQQAQGQRPASATAEGRDAQPEGPLP